MSKKLQEAVQKGNVTVRSKSSGELAIWYIDAKHQRRTVGVSPYATKELAPKLAPPANFLRSNIQDLVRQGVLAVL